MSAFAARVALLLVSFVMLVGCSQSGLSAAASHFAPEDLAATSHFAPEDLAATLPHQVGDIELEVEPQTIAEFVSVSPEKFQRVLAEAGKTPADVIAAIALSEPTRQPSLHIGALRVRGLDPQPFTQTLYAAYSDPPWRFTTEEIDGKTVQIRIDSDGFPKFTYFHGEVAYYIGANAADPAGARLLAEAALAALP